jgi:hypothetical protein
MDEKKLTAIESAQVLNMAEESTTSELKDISKIAN